MLIWMSFINIKLMKKVVEEGIQYDIYIKIKIGKIILCKVLQIYIYKVKE